MFASGGLLEERLQSTYFACVSELISRFEETATARRGGQYNATPSTTNPRQVRGSLWSKAQETTVFHIVKQVSSQALCAYQTAFGWSTNPQYFISNVDSRQRLGSIIEQT